MKKPYKRRKKLVNPVLQLRVALVFLALAFCLKVADHFFLLKTIESASTEVGIDLGAVLAGPLVTHFVAMCLITLPLVVGVAVLLTFPIAGPAFRMERHLRQIANGERQIPCRLRDGDELASLCEAMNLAVAHLEKQAGLEPTDAKARTANAEETGELADEKNELPNADDDSKRDGESEKALQEA